MRHRARLNPNPFSPTVIGLSPLGNNDLDDQRTYTYVIQMMNKNFTEWSNGNSKSPDGWTLTGVGASIARSTAQVYLGTYSALLTSASANSSLKQNLAVNQDMSNWVGKTIQFQCWVWSATASKVYLNLQDGGTVNVVSAYHTGNSTWQLLTLTATISATAAYVNISCNADASTVAAYFNTVTCYILEEPANAIAREVPLVYDSVSGTYCSPLDKVNQEERLAGLEVARLTNDDQRFLGAAGFVNGPTDPSTTNV